MQTVNLNVSKRFNFSAFALALAGLVAAAAHADPGKDLGAASPIAMPAQAQCTDVDAMMAKFKYPAGTTFKLTETGFVVLSKPRDTTTSEPEWPNFGN